MNFRRARIGDIESIVGLLRQQKSGVIHRSAEEVRSLVDGFWVALDENWKIVACCGTKLWDAQEFDVEVISFVTQEAFRRQGIGTTLLCICLRGSLERGLSRFFALTTKDKADNFRKLGFIDIDRACLPQKVLVDCVRCPNRAKNPYSLDCDEVPLAVDFSTGDSYIKLKKEYYCRRFPLAYHYRIGR